MTTSSPPPRFEHSVLPNGIRVALNSNHKLKTILVKAYFTCDLDADTTRRALVPMVLRRGTRTLPDMQRLNRRQEELYACALYSSIGKVGEWHVVRFTLDVVNEAFLPGERGVLRQGLELMREMLYDPLVSGDGFRPDYVAQEKHNLRRSIESLIDDKGTYALFRCIEEMCSSERYRLHEQGRIDEIDPIEPRGLFEFYRRWSRSAPLAIYLAGDISMEAAKSEIASVFDEPRDEPLVLSQLPGRVEVGETREVRERLDVNQGKLVLGFRQPVRYGDPEYEALVLFNTVLGGGGNSRAKLFQNVREKASMAYSAYSSTERTKGLLFMTCGIAVENYQRAVDLCLEQVEDIKRGRVTAEEMEAALRTVLNSNLMLEDNFSALAEADFVRSLHGCELDLESMRERLQKVSIDDLIAVANRLQHDTTYFLHS